MTDLQALITGAIAGWLSRPDSPFLVTVTTKVDEAGTYQPELVVTGQQSGEVVTIHVNARA